MKSNNQGKGSEWSNQLVVLVHGFGRTKKDMSFLESGFKRIGFTVHSETLPTYLGSLDDCKQRLSEQVEDKFDSYEKVHFVAHSMGGLITYELLRHSIPSNIGRCVFIGTPHKGTKVADIANRIPGISSLIKPLQCLVTDRDEPDFSLGGLVEIGAIAGTKNNLLTGRLFLSKNSDGRVESSSVRGGDIIDFKELPYGHLDIHFQHETIKQVISFLGSGKFH